MSEKTFALELKWHLNSHSLFFANTPNVYYIQFKQDLCFRKDFLFFFIIFIFVFIMIDLFPYFWCDYTGVTFKNIIIF